MQCSHQIVSSSLLQFIPCLSLKMVIWVAQVGWWWGRKDSLGCMVLLIASVTIPLPLSFNLGKSSGAFCAFCRGWNVIYNHCYLLFTPCLSFKMVWWAAQVGWWERNGIPAMSRPGWCSSLSVWPFHSPLRQPWQLFRHFFALSAGGGSLYIIFVLTFELLPLLYYGVSQRKSNIYTLDWSNIGNALLLGHPFVSTCHGRKKNSSPDRLWQVETTGVWTIVCFRCFCNKIEE